MYGKLLPPPGNYQLSNDRIEGPRHLQTEPSKLVAVKRFEKNGRFKLNEASGTISSVTTVSDYPLAFPPGKLGPVFAGLLQLPPGLARMTS